MKKRLKELQRRLPAIALAVVMSMGTAMSAFAAGNPVYGSETTPARAAITKKLTMPIGTPTPAATFTFHVQPVSVDDRSTPEDLATMPALGDKNIAFIANEAGADNLNTKTIVKQTDNLFSSATFPHAGKYVYKVTEEEAVSGYAPAANEAYIFSHAEYTLTAYVKNGTNGLYVAAVASQIAALDSSNGNSVVGDKVDPTPDGDPNIEGDYSKMIFTNIYSKTAGGIDSTDPTDKALTISKTVTGDYADRTRYFAFDVAARKPEVIPGDVTYKAYVLDASNNIVTSTENYMTLQTDSNSKPYISFSAGIPMTVNLKHDQRLVFTDLHIGASYDVTEAAVQNYTASLAYVVNGGTPGSTSNTEGNLQLGISNILIGKDQNSAAFTNEYQTVTPTGVVINNLPFVMILILAAGSFIAFVAVKSRKKRSRA
ncbi:MULTISPECIES: Spy0128 family protein [unclassified Lacrimispora]|uniref:DUF7601 domain-containing protein n=1 Tax=unclassified Lacrimispora TaxID=2719232 RepID=UPI0037701A23